ncbi:MAG: SusD/RagB family nutrient-binding outer membrane lipoprotein [Flavobacteriaceae bacterium]|jgi:hypothetical protein|nr:SusD/RagB family nutrient-binding outer membrane lipoprotein [Flavobacteriaceae bacterium]MBT6705833.1 SusD/RagB family nutrient-binding outer membrane lipoprotein [Flavobacteriaceae bacterium]
MKNLNKISVLLILLLGLTFTSCETTDLDLINDPNQITVENGDLERYMVSIQVDFARFAEAMGNNGARLVRIEQMGATNYVNAFEPVFTNYEWGLAYVNMFSDIQNAIQLAKDQETELIGYSNHIAVMKILKAYTLITLVDYFGDIPRSEANNLAEFPQPSVDSGSSVYEFAIALLQEAKELLGGNNFDIANDFYYNNNFDQWVKLANTLKMQAYVNTNNVSEFNTLKNEGNFISDTSDDFVWNYNVLINDQIDARSPGYQSDYTAGGVTRYRSDYLMDKMLKDNDPRRRYYFFRQNDCTPGALKDINGDPNDPANQCAVDPERLFCSTQPRPALYPGASLMVFCSVDNGYWGRDHGFGGGIPPDTFKRTAGGVYPIAGNFDDNRFSSVGIGQGGGGAGITPIYLASWSHLMLAEMALSGGGDAASHLRNAMGISIAKVMSFGSKDGDADLSTTDDGGYVPTDFTVDQWINLKTEQFFLGNYDDKMNILGEQHLIAHYGNGSNSYNFYRRTGYPHTLQWTVEPAPGGFVRSLFYPADEANTNPNIAQKPDVSVKVFWDNNPASSAAGPGSTGFPIAN